ncbi:MAG TPA: biotin--[acetyl-CoA-carboxylase] ligase [Caulobacteraceae bacterium]|jgi:BirA family biotin operon repressor/biotin-[acetyl-CoA-carboxylase] ligase|nr:biotin--[acetyl-CoA-carboxylase] ligase [Caulobacteraceae bacterium]
MISARTAVPILTLDEIDSTNSEARRRAEAGEAGPLWITALSQTAGRGRRGRAWETGQGNLAATLLMTTTREPREAAQVSFIAALAASDLARAHLPAERVQVKWPNDVLVDGRKLVGILVESGQRREGDLWLAVGVGFNLAKAPDMPERPATSLAAETRTPPPEPRVALEGLAAAFADWLEVWDHKGFAAIVAAWTARAYGLGQTCTARLAAETVEGVAEGLDSDGALRLRLADGGLRRITAGDVFFGSA